MSTGYIAAISRGHNSGVCLLKDGKIVFAIEEERVSRTKYDGSPLAAMNLIKQYTPKIDYLLICHTHPLDTAPRTEFMHDDIYTGMARKLGLINRKYTKPFDHPQVIDVSKFHHKVHAACAFYRSGFDEAAALVVDGAGSIIPLSFDNEEHFMFEVESIFDCSYPSKITLKYKHYAAAGKIPNCHFIPNLPSTFFEEPENTHQALVTDCAGITKVYEAVTEYCGFQGIEAGKTMGLFPYGKPNDDIPPLFTNYGGQIVSNRNLVTPSYPGSAMINHALVPYLNEHPTEPGQDRTKLQNRRDLAYACQKDTQEQMLKLIYKAVELTGKRNVVLSGGYGLNCVANYYYLEQLRKDNINLYVEPISNDGGTAIGAALMFYYMKTQTTEKMPQEIYLGPQYVYPPEYITGITEYNGGTITDATPADIVKLLREKNIVTIFQGRSENGPRALGNRSVLFDPTFPDGKDFVNSVKHREYFRPFAGSILQEHVHDWFDLRGMNDSPFMMYAVNCQPGVEEKIPSIIHEDHTCRIQTVTREQNKHYYELIEEFYKQTGIPIIFNTSFNLGGEPLVETLEDAIWTLFNSDIEYLYLPEYGKLIKIPNERST